MKQYKVLFSLIFFIFATLLTGCSEPSYASIDTTTTSSTKQMSSQESIKHLAQSFEMELIGTSKTDNGKYEFYRETLTDVVYIQYREKNGYAGMGGLTVMLDPETGRPLTYARYMELYSKTSS